MVQEIRRRKEHECYRQITKQLGQKKKKLEKPNVSADI